MKTIISVSLVILLCGCVQVPNYMAQIQSRFNETDLAPYRAKGTGIVNGQAFLKTQGGDVKVAAGDEVALIPATPYMREAVTYFQQGVDPTNYARSLMNEVIRRTQADAQGNFEFKEIPAGKYLLQVKIVWLVPGYSGGTAETGGLVLKEIDVRAGETIRVMLTR